jgi:lysozyme
VKGATKVIGGGAAAVILGASALLVTQEGLVLHTYADPVWGERVPTACVGETGPHIRMGQTFTREQCMQMLGKRVELSWSRIERCLTRPVPVNVAVSLVDLGYNVGEQAVCSSTLVRQINTGQPPSMYCEQFRRWVFVGGKDCRDPKNNCRGIVTRREHARALCLGQTPVPG